MIRQPHAMKAFFKNYQFKQMAKTNTLDLHNCCLNILINYVKHFPLILKKRENIFTKF